MRILYVAQHKKAHLGPTV